MDHLTAARERFAADVYATETTGIEIEAAEPGYARCSFIPDDRHMNAVGGVMGGALFTLCDFAFAIAANTESPLTQSLTSQIAFHTVAKKGVRVTAEARRVRAGRSTCYYNIDVIDETGRHIATTVISGFIHSSK